MAGHGPGGPARGRFLTEEEKKNKPVITRALLLRIFSYLKPYGVQLVLGLALILAISFLGILPSILTGRMIDDGLIGRDLHRLVVLILLSFGVQLLSSLLSVGQGYLNNWIAQHISFDMKNQMYRHLQQMSHRFFTEQSQGDIITRMTSDISGVESVIANTFASILSNSLTLLVAVVAMWRMSIPLTLLCLLALPIFVVPTRIAGKTRWSITRQAQDLQDELNGILSETMSVSGQLLMKLFGKEKEEYERYEGVNRRMMNLTIRERMSGRWFFMILQTVSQIGPMLLYLVGGILIIRYDSSVTVGDITVMVGLLSRLYGPVNSLLNFQVDWIRSMALFTRIFAYYDMPVEIQNAPDAICPEGARGELSFRHVDFSYDGSRKILSDVSFTLGQGKSIALVGPSGAGKSSIAHLIPRLFDVTGGEVLFDGIDVRKLDLSFLRRKVGMVSQETYLFNGTIRENLLYAKASATEEEMISACQKAGIYSFIQKLPDGLDTLVGNRGLKLSGGEKQRLSIARVLLKDPALLIFDEATSSLDSISEKLIQDAIDPLIHSRSSILIAHRLSTVLAADEILVVKDGRIVERGTHQELSHAGGTYEELCRTQFRAA